MRYFLAVILSLWCYTASADVYVITAQDKSVYSISEADDAVLPVGYTKDVIKGKDIKSLMLSDDTSVYNYNGKKFTLDDKKVSKKNKDLQDASIAREAKKSAKESAKLKLKTLGLTDEEISALGGN